MTLDEPYEISDFVNGIHPDGFELTPAMAVEMANAKFKKILSAGKKMYSMYEGNSIWTTYVVPSYKYEGVLINVHEHGKVF